MIEWTMNKIQTIVDNQNNNYFSQKYSNFLYLNAV